MAGPPEERYKAAMANAVKTIKSQKEQIAELQARLKTAEQALTVEKARVQELQLALKRKRADEDEGDAMDQDDEDGEDWDGRRAAKKGRTGGGAAAGGGASLKPPAGKAAASATATEPSSTKPAVSSFDILGMKKSGGGGTGRPPLAGAAGSGKEGKKAKEIGKGKGKGKEKEGAAVSKAEKEEDSGSSSKVKLKTEEAGGRESLGSREAAAERGGRREEKDKDKEELRPASSTAALDGSSSITTTVGETATATSVLEEVAQLWALVKDRPFADAKYAQLCLDRYVFRRGGLASVSESAVDAGVQRCVLLLREAGQVSPQEACRRLLVTYKRRMAQALKRDRAGRWLLGPVQRHAEAGRLLGGAAALALRLCGPESYGAYFAELVLDELLMQLYKAEKAGAAAGAGAGGKRGKGVEMEGVGGGDGDEEEDEEEEDEEDEEGSGAGGGPMTAAAGSLVAAAGAGEREKEAERRRHREESFRRQRHGFAAAALYTAVCRATGGLGRARALLYDVFALNGRRVALGLLPAVLGVWPAVLGPADGLMARTVLALAHEAYLAQRRGPRGGEGSVVGDEAVCWASELAFEGLATAVMGLAPPTRGNRQRGEEEGKEDKLEEDGGGLLVYEGISSVEEVAEEALSVLHKSSTAAAPTVGEAVRALVLLCGARPLEWAEERLLQPFATGEASTAPGVMRLLAALGREVSLRDAVERRSGEVMRRLLLCFSEAVAAVARAVEKTGEEGGENGLGGAADWLEGEDEGVTPAPVGAANGMEEGERAVLEEVRLWACKGLAELPGIGLGELKPVVQWCRSLAAAAGATKGDDDQEVAVPAHVLRTLVYSQTRPHCVAVVRERQRSLALEGAEGGGQQQDCLELQAILHDVSVHAVQAQALAQLSQHAFRKAGAGGRAASVGVGGEGGGEEKGAAGGPAVSAAARERHRALWAADGGLEHAAVWHVYANSRMDEMDFLNRKPSEAIVLEGDAVGSPLLGTELRNLLFELRYRPFPWDVLLLCFSLTSAGKAGGGGNKAPSPFAVALPKGAHPSRRGYILSHTGAVKLLRSWDQYESVEALLASEARAGRLTVLVPGDARPVVHPSAEDRMLAATAAAASSGPGGWRGRGGGAGGGGGMHGGAGGGRGMLAAPEALPFGFGQGMGAPVPSFPGFSVVTAGVDDDVGERPPSPGFRPSDD